MSDLEAPPESKQLIATGDSVQADQSSESESSKQKTVTLTLNLNDTAGDTDQALVDARKYSASGQTAVSRKNCNEERRTVDQDSEPPQKTRRLMRRDDSTQLLAQSAPLSHADQNNNNNSTDSSQVLPLATSNQVEEEESAEAKPKDIVVVGGRETLPSVQDTNLESGEQQSEETEPHIAETTDTEIENVTDGSQVVALPQEEQTEPTDVALMQNGFVAPVRAENATPVRAEDVTPVQGYGVALVQSEGEAPVQAEGVAPVRAEDVTPVQGYGVAPVQSEGEAPVQAEGVAPVRAEDVTPVQGYGVAPVQSEGEAPVQAEGVAPVRAEDVTPVQGYGVAPVQSEGEAPVQAEGVAPVQAGNVSPMQEGFVAPVQAGDRTPVSAGSLILFYEGDLPPVGAEETVTMEGYCLNPVQAEKMLKMEQQTDMNQRKFRKFYWNFILTTYFTTLNDIDSNKLHIETVKFHGMLVEICEFDKSSAWAMYERWTLPTLIKKLLGPMTTWEELNDTQHQFCRAFNCFHEQEIYKNSAKKVLAYLHNRLSRSIEPRLLCRLSNEFESDVWDWMLCNYQTNVEMYVVAQEEIRGRLSPNLDYATFPAFVDRLQFYSKCKNKDASSALLFACYTFFREHVHIQREVLSDDFQKMFTQPEDSLKDVEMEYFQRVLGLVNKMIVF